MKRSFHAPVTSPRFHVFQGSSLVSNASETFKTSRSSKFVGIVKILQACYCTVCHKMQGKLVCSFVIKMLQPLKHTFSATVKCMYTRNEIYNLASSKSYKMHARFCYEVPGKFIAKNYLRNEQKWKIDHRARNNFHI